MYVDECINSTVFFFFNYDRKKNEIIIMCELRDGDDVVWQHKYILTCG